MTAGSHSGMGGTEQDGDRPECTPRKGFAAGNAFEVVVGEVTQQERPPEQFLHHRNHQGQPIHPNRQEHRPRRVVWNRFERVETDASTQTRYGSTMSVPTHTRQTASPVSIDGTTTFHEGRMSVKVERKTARQQVTARIYTL